MKTYFHFKAVVFLIALALIVPGTVLAKMTKIEGKIGGANCVIKKGMCPMKDNDAHLALENDFVLSTGDKYYFMPNISRSQKIGLVGKDVRVTGDLEGYSLVASVIEVKEGASYEEVWNWDKITATLGKGK